MLFDGLDNGAGGVDSGLGGVDGAHDIGSGGGVQAEGPGDAGHLSGGQHEAKPQEGFVAEHHKPRHQNGGLEEGAETQAMTCLHHWVNPSV